MTLDDILARLDNVQGREGQRSARCPAHDDHANSLSVSAGKDGRILLKCHAGCTAEEICSALGLTVKDLFPDAPGSPSRPAPAGGSGKPHPKAEKKKGKKKIVARYDYYDRNGVFLYQKTRWRYENGEKSFLWSHKDSNGHWKDKRGDAPLILYNEWEALEHDRVFLVEGEKDVETMRTRLHLPAVSTPDGAEKTLAGNARKWKPHFTEALTGKHVVIIQDNDGPGKTLARYAASVLHGKAASVKLLDLTQEWPELKVHGDITDVLEAEPDGAESVLSRLLALESITPEYIPEEAPPEEPDPETSAFFDCFKSLDDFEEEEATWLCPGWIPEGQITLLAADGGIGKTTLWCNIISALSSGATCILDPPDFEREPVPVAFLTTEDSVRKKLRRKLRLAGADMKNIITPDFLADQEGLLRDFKFGTEKMALFVRRFRPKLVIFDPVQGFVPPEINMGSRNAMRDCMAPLISLGEECGTTFLVICHTNKRRGASGRDRIADSADLWDVARSVLMAGYTEDQGVRYLSNEKNNYEQLQETLLFTIDGDGQPHLEGKTWKRDRDYQQDIAIAKSAPKRDDCKEFLLQLLDDNDGSMKSKDLEERAKECGYSHITIRRAKKSLRESGAVRYRNEGFGKEKVWIVEKTAESETECFAPVDLTDSPFSDEPGEQMEMDAETEKPP